MVRTRTKYDLRKLFPGFVCLLTLTGCSGTDDWLRPNRATLLKITGPGVCLVVPDAGDYQPANIAINPRETPALEKNITVNPALRIKGGKLCILPTFYVFPKNEEFIVTSVLTSQKQPDQPRKILAGLTISDGHITSLPLTDKEILREYKETSPP